MFFKYKPRMPQDSDVFNPTPVKSRFINIDRIPADLDALPNQLWPFCWFFLKQLGWPMVICFACIQVSNVIWLLYPMLAREMMQVFENNTGSGDLWAEVKPIFFKFIFLFVIIMNVLFIAGRHIFAHISSAFRDMVIYQLTAYTMRHSISFFQNDFAGRLASKITDTANGLRDNLQNTLYALSFAFTGFILTIGVVFTVHPIFTVIFGAWTLTYAITLFLMIPRVLFKAALSQNTRTRINGRLVDVITNIYNVKLFSRMSDENSSFMGYLQDHIRKGRHLAINFNIMHLILDTQIMVFFIIILGTSFHLLETGQMRVSDAVLIIPVMVSLSNMTSWLFETLFFFFEAFGNIQDGMNTLVKPFGVKDKNGETELKTTEGHIELKNVDFTYPGRQIFASLDIDILPGQKIGLVGPSGAGKSTLVQLLLRLHDIQGGEILIDGQNIADVTQDSLREHIAVIPQNAELLHRSIRENIAYGRMDATEDDIIEAARRAHAHEFILGLQDHEGNKGYDAMVGERGVKLSGGQRQRVAIARAILKNAPILLLDEATSALDSESEKMIQESLKELMVGRTVIAIAHRLSTIAQLDRLLVMEDGRIIEDGNHYKLLEQKGLYARLWALQSGGFLGDGHH